MLKKPGEELRTLPVSAIPRARKRQPHRHGVRRVETGIDVEQMLEAPHQEAGADQKHEREGDFDDDERAPRAIPARHGSRAAAFLERVVQAGSGSGERGNGAEDQAAQQRRAEREGQDPAVDPDQLETLDGQPLGGDGPEKMKPPPRQQQTADAARRGKHEAFGEQLPDEARASGAERRPDGKFPLSHRRAGQEQVRHVRARDEEHERDRAGEHQQRRAHARR